MSGIAGIRRFDEGPVDASRLEAMKNALAHRGPDGAAAWRDEGVGFAQLTLWTTPESIAEKLPLVDRTRGLAIVADARIDNREDLFRDLDPRRSSDVGDAELILNAYAKWGESCCERLVGDFAFAIWDAKRRTLFAARDRIGVKPFYYCRDEQNGEFAFASEISPLFVGARIEKRPDSESLAEYIETSNVAHERTFFADIRRLPPASTMSVRDGRVVLRKYWEPASGGRRLANDLDAHAEEFCELLTTAVKAQSRSAFPIGCLLSGGLDSSSVLCLASRVVPDRSSLFALSMVFDDLPCDEREYIREAIRSAGVAWTPHVVDGIEFDGWRILEDCFARQPEWPVQDLPASETLWPLVRTARERGARVVLTGTGGDQVAQGSTLYLADLLASFRFVSLFRELAHYRFSRSIVRSWTLEPLLPEGARRAVRRFEKLFGRGRESWSVSRAADEEWRNPYRLPKGKFKSVAAWQEACWIADPLLSLYLDGWWDTLGGRGQIEFRHPFFDVRLVEFMQTLPLEEKFWRGESKVVMRKAMERILPDQIRMRRNKAEFSPIVGLALRSMKITPSSLALSRMGIVEGAHVDALSRRESAASSPQWATLLWRLVRTDVWFRKHFDVQPLEKIHVS